MSRTTLYTSGGLIIGIALLFVLWLIFSSAPAQTPGQNPAVFGVGSTVNTTVTPQGTGTNQLQPLQNQSQKIFKISDGPVAGAGFIQTLHPTTTLARWVMADTGHTLEVAVDSPGAVPRPLSNTTIPGAMSARWVQSGAGAVLQYVDNTTPKTVYLGLPAATSSPTRILFYPDGIVSLAPSPDGESVAYLLRTSAGTDGYIVKADGTGGKKLFSLPLKEVQLLWPAPGTLLAYSNSAAGVPGIAFTIDAKTGVVTPLVYGPGLTAVADANFAHIVYQTVAAGATARSTFVHDTSSGTERPLSFDPFPEKCVPGKAPLIYCAAPLSFVPPNYLDLWHQGAASAPDAVMAFNVLAGTSTILAAPGGDGGVATDILSLSVSPDAHYLLYVSKFDRSLWGVRLAQ